MNNFDDVKVYNNESVQNSGAMDLIGLGEIVRQDRTPYMTAVSVVRPRQLGKVKDMVMSEIEIAPDEAFYSWDVNDKRSPAGKKEVIGGTIGLAMSIARNYGNCAIPTTTEETPTHTVFTSTFIDLESGFTLQRSFRLSKRNTNLGNYNVDRAEDMQYQIGQSKSIRNVTLQAVPKGLVTKAIAYAKELIAKEINSEGIEKSRENSVAVFKELGVSIEQLGEYTGIYDPEKWSHAVITKLRTLYKAIKNGDVEIYNVFPPKEKETITGDKDALKTAKTAPKTEDKPKQVTKPTAEEKPIDDTPEGQPKLPF
jgi:hypothetical protein